MSGLFLRSCGPKQASSKVGPKRSVKKSEGNESVITYSTKSFSAAPTVLKQKRVGKYYIVLVKYEVCDRFDGKKLLLMNSSPESILDPHISANKNIIARFEPTDKGWEMAAFLATNFKF